MTKTAQNLERVRKKIEDALKRSGRKEGSVTLVAVTKTVPPTLIDEAIEGGARVLGENRVQELREKYSFFPEAQWHIIGHLQTNKVKYAVGTAKLIHSIDSLRLINAIDECAKKRDIVQDILLEVNISGEESKYGLTLDEIPTIIKEVSQKENVSFKGFMTMAPKDASEEEIRNIFRRAKTLFDNYKSSGAEILSMGMSGDYEIAVEEGATHVRVGSAIFKDTKEG